MTIFLEAPPAPLPSVTTSQLETAQRIWGIAGLPPTTGYATCILAVAVATDVTLSAALATVDLGDVDSMTNAVDLLLRWRQRTFGPTT